MTINGYLTDTEWNGVAEKIETALNDAFTVIELLPLKNAFKGVFASGDIKIIVEKNPVGYTQWKTSTNGKAMYLSFSVINTNLQASINAAVEKMQMLEEGYF